MLHIQNKYTGSKSSVLFIIILKKWEERVDRREDNIIFLALPHPMWKENENGDWSVGCRPFCLVHNRPLRRSTRGTHFQVVSKQQGHKFWLRESWIYTVHKQRFYAQCIFRLLTYVVQELFNWSTQSHTRDCHCLDSLITNFFEWPKCSACLLSPSTSHSGKTSSHQTAFSGSWYLACANPSC